MCGNTYLMRILLVKAQFQIFATWLNNNCTFQWNSIELFQIHHSDIVANPIEICTSLSQNKFAHVFASPLNSKTQISQIILLSNITLTFIFNSDISNLAFSVSVALDKIKNLFIKVPTVKYSAKWRCCLRRLCYSMSYFLIMSK